MLVSDSVAPDAQDQRRYDMVLTTAGATGSSYPAAGAEAHRNLLDPEYRSAKKIAIVEDELAVAWALEAVAEDLGHSVVGTFSTGRAALDGLQHEDVDLIFMDINLGGGMDGIETARQLGTVRPVPVLFISGFVDPEMEARVAGSGMQALLIRKPVGTEGLKRAVEQLTGSGTGGG